MKQMFTKTLQIFLMLISMSVATAQAQNVLAGLTSNGGVAGKGTAFTIKTDGTAFNVIKPFEDWGKVSHGDLYKNSDGFFYGFTSTGGTYGSGTIFKMSSSGTVSIVRHLNSITDGSAPTGELIKGFDGNFYGLTSGGGTNTYGTIFKMSSTGTYTVLRHLSYATDGTNPRGHLVQGKDSAFYGITYGGGSFGYGTIFKITTAGVFTVLRHMNRPTDGGQSYSSLVEGKDGNLYGITYAGGTLDYGTIFKITKAGVFTVLKNLNATTDGSYPQGDLMQATDGNLYGSCYTGGTFGNGTIFKITTAGVLTVLRHLAATADGGNPYGVLYQNSDGVLYGLNRSGGAFTSGTAFKITTAGAFTVLHSFIPATEGSYPNGGFVKGNDGNLYAVASGDGAYGGGTAFRMTTAGAVTVLAHFNGAKFGNTPAESLVKGKDSAYYGTNSTGGAYGHGTIFKICAGVTSTLYSFNRNISGGTPLGSLIQATDGNFYGTASDGGSSGYGTIFKITPEGTFSVIKHFTPVADGGIPKGSLIQGKDSLLYGTTSTGGTNTGGTVFKVSLTGAYTVLRHLTYATDSSGAEGGLVQAADGNFYGMTYNNAKIFKITPAGLFSIVRTLAYTADGANPLGSMVKHPDGNLYGMTSSGGTNVNGTIFKLTTAGVYSVIKHLNGIPDGKTPKGDLLVAADGNLYGMTSAGGSSNAGTIFKISTAGVYTVLRNLNLTTDGGNPFGALIVAPVNNLIATPQSVTTNEDVAKTITLAGTGGSPLAFNIVQYPPRGTVSTGTAAVSTYTPSLNKNGVDSFAFNLSVGCVASAPAFVKITVAPVADTPVLAAIGNKSIKKDSLLTFKATATDGDAGQVITYSMIGAPAGASISSTTGTFTWKPTVAGTYTFTIRATDNAVPALYDEEQITITVTLTLAPKASKTTIANSTASTGIYPNPVQDKFFVKGTYGEVWIVITDMAGSIYSSRRYTSYPGNILATDAHALKPDVYVITVKTNTASHSFKIIKQ